MNKHLFIYLNNFPTKILYQVIGDTRCGKK